MLGVDTNVLIRFLTIDDAGQSAVAAAVFAEKENQPVYLSMLVLAEAFTVMTRVQKFPPSAVLDSYRLLLSAPAIEIERPDLVLAAIEDAARTKAGFTDALIALQNIDGGCGVTATFDVRAMRLDTMRAAKDFA